MIVVLLLLGLGAGLVLRQRTTGGDAMIGPRQGRDVPILTPSLGLPPLPCSVGETLTVYDADASPPTDRGAVWACGPEIDFACIRGPAGTTCGRIVG